MNERNLSEVYHRRLERTRDAELKWLLTTLGVHLERLSEAHVAAYRSIQELGQAWQELGLIKARENE